MSEDDLLRKEKGFNRGRYIPVIMIVVVVSILIAAGYYMGKMARKINDAHPEIEISGPFTEPTIDSLPPVFLRGKSYKVIVVDSLVWLAENLDYDIGEESLCLDNDSSYCSKYGRLYTYEGAIKACEEIGWRLPTKAEWDALRGGFGSDRNAYAALIKGGETGFDGVLGGGYNLYDDKVEKPETVGSYWSSTEDIPGDEYAWKYAFRPQRRFMSRDLYRKQWSLSCRCVKPVSTIQIPSDENAIMD